MTILQLFRVLWAHRWAELATVAAVVALAVGGSILLPKQYTATATMFLDVRTPDRIPGTVVPGMTHPGDVSTQIDIVKSDRVTHAVAKSLKLDQREFIRSTWMDATNGDIEFDGWVAEYLQKRLRVVPSSDSNVIYIHFTGNTPVFAAEGANAYARAYRDMNLELKLEPARTYAAWLDDQTQRVRARLEAAQRALSEFQQRSGILPADREADVETARLNDLTKQLTELQGEIASDYRKLNAPAPGAVADVMDSDVVNALKIDVARVGARLRDAGSTLSANHPQLIRLKEELGALKAQLARETALVGTSIGTRYDVERQRERDLQQAIAEQKQRVLAANRQRDELNVYSRDVESAQRAFEEVSQRAARSRLESVTNQADVVGLSTARPPIRPARPRLLFIILAATCAGGMAALGLGLLLELRHRRVRSTDDLGALQLPVLATLRPHRPERRDRLGHVPVPYPLSLQGKGSIHE